MTIRYIYNASAQDDSDSTWNSSTVSYTTVQAAFNAYSAGDVYLMAHDHSESGTGTQTRTCAGTTFLQKAPVYRVNRTTLAYSGVPSTANITVTGGGDLVLNCHIDWHGVYFAVADDFDPNSFSSNFTDCYIELTSNDGGIYPGTAGNDTYTLFKNCTINGSSTTMKLVPQGAWVYLIGCTFLGAARATGYVVPTGTSDQTNIIFDGCDFSDFASSDIMVDVSASNDGSIYVCFNNCQFPTTYQLTDGGHYTDAQVVEYYACDEGTSHGQWHTGRDVLRGTCEASSSLYLTSGYSDADGAQGVGMVMTPRTSTTDVSCPVVSTKMYARIDSTGTYTFEVEALENFTTALTKQEAWMEVLYLGNSAQTDMNLDDQTRVHYASSPGNLDTGAGTGSWTGTTTGYTSVKFSASGIVVNQVGLYMVRIFLGKYEAGKDLIYNPKVTVS